MSGPGGMDIRLPIGVLFTVLGVLIGGYGLSHGAPATAVEIPLNLDLYWGAVMLVFGVVLLWAARHSRRGSGPRPAESTPEGRETERREHKLVLEDSDA